MVPQGFYIKKDAIEAISQATGFGIRIIERKFAEMIELGEIKWVDYPDHRYKIMSEADVQKVIKALQSPLQQS